jgi:hypothetical protein
MLYVLLRLVAGFRSEEASQRTSLSTFNKGAQQWRKYMKVVVFVDRFDTALSAIQ